MEIFGEFQFHFFACYNAACTFWCFLLFGKETPGAWVSRWMVLPFTWSMNVPAHLRQSSVAVAVVQDVSPPYNFHIFIILWIENLAITLWLNSVKKFLWSEPLIFGFTLYDLHNSSQMSILKWRHPSWDLSLDQWEGSRLRSWLLKKMPQELASARKWLAPMGLSNYPPPYLWQVC